MTRTYRLKQRALTEEETRLRIVEATVKLHQEVGDARATVSAIADAAGVGRVTVYRHFPDQRALLTACTGHYFSLNPPPNPVSWQAIHDPEQRLHQALTELYAFYERNERMLARAEQDAPANPILAELLEPFQQLLRAIRDILMEGWPEPLSPPLQPLIGLALAFTTWQSLVRQQHLDSAQAVALMVRVIRSNH